ncbi:FkbM family methyltransferase [Pengzhenrongella frigida]|uniref:FkbM family methyltransferase n=1 Tax=Pengzhenrongella frigida TaxID=1259133 RepID=A0A4Q5N037_9MICO|nr:FkbM family methyltransferase [Cellulomonas sp. HLT2-17]RYV51365.1 FkbM family methyltransferase [Cellulomonas sp. HLT2-17]
MPDLAPAPRLDHLEPAAAERVLLTISCHDADDLPKVDGAGEVFELDGTTVQRMHNGVLIREGCYFGPWMTEIIRSLRGHHEPQEEVVFHELLERLVATEPDAAMVELGSFWAYYSMWFHQRTHGNRVVDLEPDPTYLEIGRRNLALNAMTATFVHGAVGDSPGQPTTFVAESTGEPIEVVQYDLGSLMLETGLARVGLLMVDIQGFETVLIERAAELFTAGAVRFMIVSTHHHQISGSALTHQHVLERLLALGAHVIAEHTVGESYSGDGLIAVSFDDRDRDMSVSVSHARAKESLFGELEVDLQSALDEVARLRAQTAELTARAARAEQDAQASSAELGAVFRSRSWRVTRALRGISRRLPRIG